MEGENQVGINSRNALLALALLSLPASAQNVVQLEKTTLQPLVYSDDKGTHGCGFRILAALNPGAPSGPLEMADFSVNFYAIGAGMMKALVYVIPPQFAQVPEKWSKEIPADFTVMPEDGSLMPRVRGKEPSPSDRALLVATEFEDAIGLYVRILEGNRLHLRIQKRGQSTYRVVSFTPTFEQAADRGTAEACWTAVKNRLARS